MGQPKVIFSKPNYNTERYQKVTRKKKNQGSVLTVLIKSEYTEMPKCVTSVVIWIGPQNLLLAL